MVENEAGAGTVDATAGRTWWQTALLLAGSLLVVGLVLAFLAPRWWGDYVADRVDDRGEVGAGLGLLIGFVCTLVPMMILWHGRRARTWRARLLVVGAAVVVALPNLLTLLVATGWTAAADRGALAMAREAQGFRVGTLVGALVALVGYPALLVLLASWRSRGRELDARRATDRARAEAERSEPPGRTEPGDRTDQGGDQAAEEGRT